MWRSMGGCISGGEVFRGLRRLFFINDERIEVVKEYNIWGVW